MYGYPALTLDLKRKILGLNAARAYGVNPTNMRCAVEQTELAAIKRQLDAERGGRRFSFVQPMVRSRRQFLQLQKCNNYEPG